MEITVTGRKMNVTDALRDYALKKIGGDIERMDVHPTDAEIVLMFEQNTANPLPAICEVTLHMKGHVVRVEEAEADMYAAIDVAAAKVLRQLRKYKTRVIDRRVRASEIAQEKRHAQAEELNLDDLMQDLAAEDDEILRVKEITLVPLTEEDALIQMDLLGHDFFAYIDRDTNAFHILYRRDNGGYGLLKHVD